MDYVEQVKKLVYEANDLGYCITAVNLLEEAVKISDSHQDVDLGFWTREELIDCSTFSGFCEKALVAFSWCLAQFDKNPEDYDSFNLLWRYKMMIQNLRFFSRISQQQIDNSINDLARRYREYGYNMKPIYKLKAWNAMSMNNREIVIENYEKWRTTPKDSSSDCRACEQNFEVEYYVYLKDWEQALVKAKPIFKKHLSCTEVPHVTVPILLIPFLHKYGKEKALIEQKKNYKMIAKNPDFLQEVASHLEFFVIIKDFAKAIELLEKHLIWSLETLIESRQFGFFRCSYLLMKSLVEEKEETIKLRLPRTFALYNTKGIYKTQELKDWFSQQSSSLAQNFDRRNGNNYHESLIDRFTFAELINV